MIIEVREGHGGLQSDVPSLKTTLPVLCRIIVEEKPSSICFTIIRQDAP